MSQGRRCRGCSGARRKLPTQAKAEAEVEADEKAEAEAEAEAFFKERVRSKV